MIVEFKIPILGVKVWIWIAIQLKGFIATAYTCSKNATCVYIYIYMAREKRMQRDQWPMNLTAFSLISPPLKPNISQKLWPWYPSYGHQKEFYYISYYNREIIVYSRSTINAYSLFSHKWWTPLIKFMVGSTIHVRGGNTHLWYSEST